MTALIVGIGSSIRGDDGVGLRVVQQLVAQGLPPGVEAIELGIGGLALLDVIDGYDQLVVVDAMVSGAEPGTVSVLSGPAVAQTSHLSEGHEADLPTMLELARSGLAGSVPAEVAVVAIEAANVTTISEQLTPPVEAAVDEAVACVLRLLALADPR
jgi:hydrogenase maturation protease